MTDATRVVDMAVARRRLADERDRLLRLPRAPWTAYTVGRASGLSLALALLDEEARHDD